MSFLPYYLRRRRMRHVQKQIRKSEKHKSTEASSNSKVVKSINITTLNTSRLRI
ncbi:MAG: hypothetical protein ACI8RD_010650 [Bacillariaceae sp.]|jgi:hypothetical protein